MKKAIIPIIIVLGVLLIYISFNFPRCIKEYTEESAVIAVKENLLILVEAIEKWHSDNGNTFPHSFNDINNSNGNAFKSYLLKPLEQPYIFTSKNINKFVYFKDDALPKDFNAIRKPGIIYVFYYNNKYVVLGFGKKNQNIIRSDSDEFKQFYEVYINEYKRIYKK